ncbi:MAG: hypothetical protein GY862_09700 [Gammaproteobacteria bacterium]|nr:hypothetical protein [Gammaproteobacteria bacterium]
MLNKKSSYGKIGLAAGILALVLAVIADHAYRFNDGVTGSTFVPFITAVSGVFNSEGLRKIVMEPADRFPLTETNLINHIKSK